MRKVTCLMEFKRLRRNVKLRQTVKCGSVLCKSGFLSSELRSKCTNENIRGSTHREQLAPSKNFCAPHLGIQTTGLSAKDPGVIKLWLERRTQTERGVRGKSE